MQMNNLFDYSNSVSSATTTCHKEDFERMLDDEKVKNLCEMVRDNIAHINAQLPEKECREWKEKANALKKQLPIITPHAHFTDSHRHNESAVQSPWCSMDFDNLEDPHDTWDTIAKAVEKYNETASSKIVIPLVFISPSGRGLKLLFKRIEGMTLDKCQEWFAEVTWQSDFDHTQDLARSCYMVGRESLIVYEPDVLFAKEIELMTVDQVAGNAPSPQVETEKLIDENASVPDSYNGIPYSKFIDKYWELFNEGKTPTVGDRNTKIFELVCNIRHICGFDANVLFRIIPRYDGFPEDEFRQTIINANNEKHGRMPQKVTQLIKAVRAENSDNVEVVQAVDEFERDNDSYYFNQVPKKALPMGYRDSVEGANMGLEMPIIVAIGPMVGALATHVRLSIHNKMFGLNLISYLVGDAASNKSDVDEVDKIWMKILRDRDIPARKVEDEYRTLPAKTKEKTKEPHEVIRCQALRTSISDVLFRLMNSQGLHVYSFAPESDAFSQGNRIANCDATVLVRQAYDGSSFSSSYRSDKATNCVIDSVLWNLNLTGTPDALHRFCKNTTDGMMTRLSLSRCPDNTFSPLSDIKPRSQEAVNNIYKIAEILDVMRGELVVEKLEQRCREWLEKVRVRSMKDNDTTQARLRFRCGPTAMRHTMCHVLCAYAEWLYKKFEGRRKGALLPVWAGKSQTAREFLLSNPDHLKKTIDKFVTPEILHMFDIYAEYFLENLLFFFREKIEVEATRSAIYASGKSERKSKGSNDLFYDKLPEVFTLDDLRAAAVGANSNTISKMVYNWEEQKICERAGRGKYKKIIV